MKNAFERFVKSVVQETDCNREEREDLSEELLVHLECAYEDLKREGYNDEEATRLAMANFGDGKNAGRKLQHAMYPYRREMLLSLAIGSLLLTYAIYLSQLFVMGDAHIGWLLLGVLTSSSLLFLTLRPIASLNRRAVMNGLLVIHVLIIGAGMLLATNLNRPFSTVLSIVVAIIILLTIVLIYRTTIYDVQPTEGGLAKGTKVVHYINITFGILLTAGTLFFLWGFLLFGGDEFQLLWKLFVPLVVWMIVYAVQLKLLMKQYKKAAYTITAVQILIPMILIGLWMLMLARVVSS